MSVNTNHAVCLQSPFVRKSLCVRLMMLILCESGTCQRLTNQLGRRCLCLYHLALTIRVVVLVNNNLSYCNISLTMEYLLSWLGVRTHEFVVEVDEHEEHVNQSVYQGENCWEIVHTCLGSCSVVTPPLSRMQLWRLQSVWRRHVASDPIEFFTMFVERAMVRSDEIRATLIDTIVRIPSKHRHILCLGQSINTPSPKMYACTILVRKGSAIDDPMIQAYLTEVCRKVAVFNMQMYDLLMRRMFVDAKRHAYNVCYI
jgi:hypothetical protein